MSKTLESMSDQQLRDLYEAAGARESSAIERKSEIEEVLFRRRISASRKIDPTVFRDLEVEGFNQLQGDARKSKSEFFMVMFRPHGAGPERSIEIVIVCPEFLRDQLRLTAETYGDTMVLKTSY